MKMLALAVGTILAGAAAAASAQTYYRPAYDPYYSEARTECLNTHNGTFERVRPGEVQDDLDFSRCRTIGGRGAYRRYAVEECWNPRAGHFEGVRPGERQDDLDFGRCRVIRDDRIAYDPYWRGY
jgi:hypothetical protein